MHPVRVTVTVTEGFYHLVTAPACQISVLPSATVDLVCQYHDAEVTSHPPCVSHSMRWQAVVSDAVRNISHSTKYGEWTAAWGLQSGHHVSLLRIRALTMDDLAMYRLVMSVCKGLPRQSGLDSHAHTNIHARTHPPTHTQARTHACANVTF